MKKDKSNENLSWKEIQNDLAGKSGLAIILTDENSVDLLKSNNNSMCEVLYGSEEFAPKCAEYCGRAFEKASAGERTLSYRCYAGLSCLAIPIEEDDKKIVAIIGRAFLNSDEYRKATKRALEGDWQMFSADELFENVLISGSPKYLKRLTKRLKNLSEDEKDLIFEFLDKKQKSKKSETEIEPEKKEEKDKKEKNTQAEELTRLIEQFQNKSIEKEIVAEAETEKVVGETEAIRAWRTRFGSLLELSYRKACVSILEFLSKRYGLNSLAWTESVNNQFKTVFESGKFKSQKMQMSISANDERLVDAVKRGVSLELRERRNGAKKNTPAQIVRLFPITVGGEIRSALVVGDEIKDKTVLNQISRFCRTVAKELEILRLREELSRRGWLENAVRVFNENIKNIDSEDFWLSLTQVTAELMNAERSSLLISDEKEKSLTVKAAIGIKDDLSKKKKKNIGKRVAKNVLNVGKPLVVKDIRKSDFDLVASVRKYKTNSFISYPITIGERKLGVFNITDKADGSSYNEFDLDLLQAIMPQLAVLVDRATLKHKAGEYEQLSLTDALTGLLNRRYLEERITEEIIRSSRHSYPMSFMMIDVDDFKAYNDTFTHLEGDKALRIVGQCLRETLRGADVAARYGGEEFSILLPQTNSKEAKVIAERIRRRIEMTPFPNRQVTVSIGVASCSSVVNTAEGLISAADLALFEAKRQGKNNVQIYENLKVA